MTPPNSLIVNGSFAANAASFTFPPGYIGGGGVNPSSITGWTDLYSAGGYGLNGTGTGVGDPFSPSNPGGLTYAFIQGGNTSVGHVLGQNLTGLAPNTTYTLVYSVAGRSGNTASYRVALYSDSTFTTSYYNSGVQAANSSGFVTVTATLPPRPRSVPPRISNWGIGASRATIPLTSPMSSWCPARAR